MEQKIIRPKGCAYITYLSIKYIFLIGLLSLAVFGLLYESPFQSGNNVKIIQGMFLVFMSVVILILGVCQTREIIRYKLIICNEYVYLSANRDLFLIRHKDIKMNYDGIKILRYQKSLRPDLIKKGMFFFSAIYIIRNNSKKEEYLLTMWFSKKQIATIIEQIRKNSELYNDCAVEVVYDN